MKEIETITDNSHNLTGKCFYCEEKYNGSDYIVNVGAFGKNDGLFSIIRHCHDGKDGITDIIDVKGQVDISFCSKECVLNFFKAHLDKLN